MFEIGTIAINNPVVSAPIAGIANLAYRKLVRQFNCQLIYTEMVSDKAIIYRNEKTLKMLEIDSDESPVALQLFGGEIASLVEAAKYIAANTKASIIDINMGCSVAKVIKAEAGANWLRREDEIYDLIRSLTQAVNLPITVKIRTGWDINNVNAINVAKSIEAGGAKAITIHGRTKSQLFSGMVDYDIIRQVKEAVNIPVIANGDIKNHLDAKKVLDLTKCDGIMIARAALGNPWIFASINEYLQHGVVSNFVTLEERLDVCFKHAEALCQLKGEQRGMAEFRTLGSWYIKYMPSSSEIRREISSLDSLAELAQLMERIKESNNEYK